MKIYLRIWTMMVAVIVLIGATSYAQPNRSVNTMKEKFKNGGSVQYKIKHGITNKFDNKQTTNGIDGTKQIKNETQGNGSYFNDRVYIKFKSSNLKLNTINPESSKLFATSFANPKMDVLSAKYDVNRIEQAFKINVKSKAKFSNQKTQIKIPQNNLKNIYTIYFNSSVDINKVIADYSKFDNVEYVEKVSKNSYFDVPNDEMYNDQFYFPIMQADEAWQIHKGEKGESTIIVGICDSGVDWTHSDLTENLYQNLAEDADGDGHTIEFIDGQWVLDPDDLDGIDNDDNGYVDDLIGWNCFTDDGSTLSNPIGSLVNQHGTHVTGIAAGMTNNTTGVASISWNVKFLPTKHGDNRGSNSIYNGYDGLVYLAENGADVINCSWGGGGYSKSEQTVIDYVNGLGTIIVAAAGNENNGNLNYPSSYHGVISVASVAKTDSKAYYSNFGPSVDISSHGGDKYVDGGILSTIPGNQYAKFQGTSMASPLVSGLTALIKSYKPESSKETIIELLLANADNIENNNPDYLNKMGFGRINAYKSLKNTDAVLSNMLKLAKVEDLFIPDQGSFKPGETVEIASKFANFNPLYGADKLSFQIKALDTNLTVINGEGTVSVDPDADFILNSLKVETNSNIKSLTAVGTLEIIFSSENGILGDSVFQININIINLDELPNAFAYVAWGGGSDPIGPVSLNLGNPKELTYLSKEDKAPVYATAGTWYEGKWYAVEDNKDFVTYDTTDGSKTFIANLGIDIDGLAYDPTTNLIWGVGGNILYTINPADGSLQLIHTLPAELHFINLACDKEGNLYSIDVNNDMFIRIDKWMGSPDLIAQLKDDYDYSQSMTFDFNTGILYAATQLANGQSSIAYFDFDTHTMNQISSIQNNDELTALIIPQHYHPDLLTLISPKFNTELSGEVEFKWNQFEKAESYVLYISEDPEFKNFKEYSTTDTSIVISGLETKQYFWDVKAIIEKTSEWSGIWMFKHADQYCYPVNKICDEYISNFELSNIGNSSDCGVSLGYSDYSNQIADIYQGVDYQIKVTSGSYYSGDICSVWIDYNNNNAFEPDEILNLTSNKENQSIYEGTINVPTTIDTGLVRLRVRLIYEEVADPCNEMYYGETEDYSIQIKLPLTFNTTDITNIKFNSAVCGGNIISDGGSPIIERGVCWSNTPNPTIENWKTSNGDGIGTYTSTITNLKSKTAYFVRAYVTTSEGTIYGDEKSFKTPKEGNFDVTINSDHYYEDMICVNEEILFTPTLDMTGNFTFLWTIDGAKCGIGNTLKHKFDGPGQYEVRVQATEQGGKYGVDWITVTITDECPVTIISDNFSTCKSSTPTISPVVFGGTGKYSYNWKPAADFVDNTVKNATVKNPIYSKPFKFEATDIATNQKAASNIYMTVLESPSVSFNKAFLNIKNNDPVDLTNEDVIVINVNDGIAPYQYKWLNKNGIEIDPTNIHPPMGTSQYFLTVTDAKGCLSYEKRLVIFHSSGKENFEDVVSGTTGLGYMITYPNPVTDNVNIFVDFDSEMPATMRIYNVIGKEVFSMAIENTKVFDKQINLSTLTAGVYTIVIETNDNTFVKQFVKH